VTEIAVELRDQPTGSGSTCRRILDALPEWFGIPESVENYVKAADGRPTVVASIDGRDVGFLTVMRHSPYAAEIVVMGVLPELHRHGIGRELVEHVERGLAADGVELLQVKTLSPRDEDEGYARTRAFYLAHGFRPLEELPDLWGPENPALQMVKVLSTP
jgi:XTP/dITP diphosphohydrolase